MSVFTGKAEKCAVSLPKDLVELIRKQSAKSHGGNFSKLVKEALTKYFSQRNNIHEETLNRIRDYLKSGATLRATNPEMAVLELRADGSMCGGLTIVFPPSGGPTPFNHNKTMTHQNDTESPPAVAETESLDGLDTHDLLTILKRYRCQYTQEPDGDACRLIDLLTPPGESTVKLGGEELYLLADFIAGEIAERNLKHAMIYVYHYHAMRQVCPGEIQHFDGLVKRNLPLTGDWDDYQLLKRGIMDQVAGASPAPLTLCSLTLLTQNDQEHLQREEKA